jgi:hypothetical protein
MKQITDIDIRPVEGRLLIVAIGLLAKELNISSDETLEIVIKRFKEISSEINKILS